MRLEVFFKGNTPLLFQCREKTGEKTLHRSDNRCGLCVCVRHMEELMT